MIICSAVVVVSGFFPGAKFLGISDPENFVHSIVHSTIVFLSNLTITFLVS